MTDDDLRQYVGCLLIHDNNISPGPDISGRTITFMVLDVKHDSKFKTNCLMITYLRHDGRVATSPFDPGIVNKLIRDTPIKSPNG